MRSALDTIVADFLIGTCGRLGGSPPDASANKLILDRSGTEEMYRVMVPVQ